MGLTMLYVFLAGQTGVVMAAVPQVALTLVTTGILFGYTWNAMDGWSGLVQRVGPEGERFFHAAGYSEPGVPGGVYLWGLILTLLAYPLVNQTVAQRIVSARSERDARLGSIGILPIWFVLTAMVSIIGFSALILLPELDSVQADTIFPTFMQQFLPSGLLGATMAAVMLASMSTGAGIGTAVAGLLVVDIYGRFFRREASDRHYLIVARVLAALVILIGTCFAMLIPEFGGMVPFYMAFAGSVFLPLTVPYIGAVYKKASRWSGLAAVVGGSLLGGLLFLFSDQLPVTLGHPQWRPLWAFGTAWICFFACSWIENRIKGPIPASELELLLRVSDTGRRQMPQGVGRKLESGADPEPAEEAAARKHSPWYADPTTYEVACLAFLIGFLVWWW